jgi:hypothetical protein
MGMICAFFAMFAAQATQFEDDQAVLLPSPMIETRQGDTAGSSVGRAGQRQSREEAAQLIGIKPMGRISGRIENRVQSRIRNRIDRYYDPQANATSPFAVADDQVRGQGH